MNVKATHASMGHALMRSMHSAVTANRDSQEQYVMVSIRIVNQESHKNGLLSNNRNIETSNDLFLAL